MTDNYSINDYLFHGHWEIKWYVTIRFPTDEQNYNDVLDVEKKIKRMKPFST